MFQCSSHPSEFAVLEVVGVGGELSVLSPEHSIVVAE